MTAVFFVFWSNKKWNEPDIRVPYLRHYNPQFVYFLPTFKVHLCTVTFGLMYG